MLFKLLKLFWLGGFDKFWTLNILQMNTIDANFGRGHFGELSV